MGSDITPGQAAFDKWKSICIPDNVYKWETLLPEVQAHWEEIAESAAMRFIEIHDMHG